jgi:hypothetical protein
MPCKCAICGYEKGITEDFMKWSDIPGLKTEFYPVTRGKPNAELLNFICARCLRDANAMKVFIKTLMSGVVVTKHAINRFNERSGSDIRDEHVGRIAVLKAFSKARRIRFCPGFTIMRIMNNDFKAADYYWVSDLVFVVTSGKPQTIVTVEKLWGKSLNKDFFFVD